MDVSGSLRQTGVTTTDCGYVVPAAWHGFAPTSAESVLMHAHIQRELQSIYYAAKLMHLVPLTMGQCAS
jgi:hypothetical protein